ncbi:hypothetical protein JHK86_009098 [Glycine max]|nr:hypothetical protein JHK86_009098 [Glycine max]
MNKEIKLQENLDCSCSGTTAVFALKEEPRIQRVWLPNETRYLLYLQVTG